MKLMQVLISLFILFFNTGCSNTKNGKETVSLTEETTQKELDSREIQIIDSWVKTALPECGFMDSPAENHVGAREINKCIEKFDIFFYSNEKLPYKLRNKVKHQFLDFYLKNKFLVYLNKLPLAELTRVFNQVIHSTYAANPKFIKLLLQKGVSTSSVGYIRPSSPRETCEVEMLIAKSNAHLYQNEKYLNKRQPWGGYPRNVLFYSTANLPTNSHCHNLVNFLINVNPELRNSRWEKGETPLHFFMESFGNRFSNSVSLGKKLTSERNINIQDSRGYTPLHILLKSSYLVPRDDINEMAKELIVSGADISLRDKKGISVRDLILKNSKLKDFLTRK